MLSFNEYLQYVEEQKKILTEGSFARLLKQITTNDKVLLFISAETKTGNRTNELKAILKTLSLTDGAGGRLGYHTIKGQYVNDDGVSRSETSFAVIGNAKALPKLEKMGRELAQKFDQESYLIVSGGKGTIVYVKDSVDENGRKITAGTRRVMSRLTVDAVSDYQSKFKGHSFSFREISEEQHYERQIPVWNNYGAQSYNDAFMEHENFFQWLEEKDAQKQRTCC